MNIALLMVEGDESRLATLASQLPGRPNRQWMKGDRRRNGNLFELSGFSVIAAEADNPRQLESLLRDFLRTCRERKVLFDPAISAELSVGFTVGDSEQFVASIAWSREDLRSLADLGIAVSITAYPTSDAANDVGAI